MTEVVGQWPWSKLLEREGATLARRGKARRWIAAKKERIGAVDVLTTLDTDLVQRCLFHPPLACPRLMETGLLEYEAGSLEQVFLGAVCATDLERGVSQ